jgi:hypothetical protein
MKKLILILSLFASTSQAQQRDTLTIQDMQYNLYRSHQEYRTGTVVSILGLLAILASVEAKNSEMPLPELGYIGAGMVTVGGIIQIDSHKWIGRAGKLLKKHNRKSRK